MLSGALVVLLVSLLAQTPAPNRTQLHLTLRHAVEIAMEDSARVRIATELARQADTRVSQARAPLLPSLDAFVSQSNATRNLQALGLRLTSPIPGFDIPTFVGPFDVFDVRATGTQTIVDLPVLRRYQAAKADRGAARNEVDAAAEESAASVARAYVAALRSGAELQAVRANIALAEAILGQAEDLKTAGAGTGMEVTRSQVQLASERQRLIVVENAGRRARLELLRATGLSLDTEIVLDDALEYRGIDPQTMRDALQRALTERPDYRAQLERVSSAKLAVSATKLERVPSVSLFGDYGSIGTSAASALATRTYGVIARIPIFDGGSRDARRAEATSQQQVEQVRTADLEKQIALEVLIALDSIRSAGEEVQVAREGLSLAEAELEQARRRYSAGVAPSLEITEAQRELARARDNLVVALFHHTQARIDLGRATGTLRNEIE